jgi:hypothetical protein
MPAGAHRMRAPKARVPFASDGGNALDAPRSSEARICSAR